MYESSSDTDNEKDNFFKDSKYFSNCHSSSTIGYSMATDTCGQIPHVPFVSSLSSESRVAALKPNESNTT